MPKCIATLNHIVREDLELVSQPSRPVAGHSRSKDALTVAVQRWFGWTVHCGLPGGYPLVVAAFELEDIVLLELYGAWRGVLAGLVRQAIFVGHLRPDLDVEQFLWELNGIYLAHHVSQRFVREADADERAWQAFECLLARSAAPNSVTEGHTRARTWEGAQR